MVMETYPEMDAADLLVMFPGRTYQQIKATAVALGARKAPKIPKHSEAFRERKRKNARASRSRQEALRPPKDAWPVVLSQPYVLERSASVARGMGKDHYFDGRPCKNGHVAVKYAGNYGCTVCRSPGVDFSRVADPVSFERWISSRTCCGCGNAISHDYRLDARFCSDHCAKGRSPRKAFYAESSARLKSIDRQKTKITRRMLNKLRSRARHASIPCDLTLEDLEIPEHCPVLGIRLIWLPGVGQKDERPSIDRKKPALGYTKGNVRVISQRANMLKSNATAAELRAVLAYVESIEQAG